MVRRKFCVVNMKFFVIPAIIFTIFHLSQAGPLRLQKRAAFYIANETACVVDTTVYNSGDPIPTDDPCEACRCRPPGFACVLKECESKPGCRAVRRAGQCCPEYICDSDNSTNVDYAFSTEKAYSNEETTVNPKTSESTLYSEIPENTQVTKENDKDSAVSPPESLDSSLLFFVNEGEERSKDAQSTKKDTSTESVSDLGSEETILDAESSEENSSEKQIENVTELLKTDYEIINDEGKPKEPEITPEQGSPEASVGSSETSAATDKNVEIFPVEETTTVEVKFKTAPPAEVTGQTTVSSTTVLPDSFEDTDDKTNELVKRFRSLKNLTSDEVIESPKENADEKSDEAKDAVTKETTEKEVTPVFTEKPTAVQLEKEIVVEDAKEEAKSSDATTEAVSKSETLYYNSEAKPASESVETVTTVVEVKEPTSSEKVDVETSSPSVSNEPEQAVFKALSDVAEANNKQETTVKSNEQTTISISDSTTPNVTDVSPSSSLPPETDKSGENVKLYADDSKIVTSTDAPKVTDVESNTTVVTEVSSEKVEPSKE